MPTFSDTLYRIYEATLSPGHWPSALHDLAELSGSRGALIYAKTAQGWTVPVQSTALDPVVQAYGAGEWWKRNPWLDGSAGFGFQEGDVYRDQDILDEDALGSHPFYRDFLARHGLAWQMAAIIHSEIGAPTAVVVQRGADGGPFARAEMDKLLVVSRHLEQSLRISSRLARMQSDHATVAAAFDAMDRPALILDRERRPVLANQSARALMGTYFTHADGRLSPARGQDEAAFAAAVRNAHALANEPGGTPAPTTLAHARDGEPLVLWAVPLVGASASQLGIGRPDSHVLVMGQSLESDRMIDPVVIRSVFGLTLGEARLAGLLGAGHTVKEAADALGITEGTARIVLKRTFQKLGVHRQADLVAKLALLKR